MLCVSVHWCGSCCVCVSIDVGHVACVCRVVSESCCVCVSTDVSHVCVCVSTGVSHVVYVCPLMWVMVPWALFSLTSLKR